MDCTWKLQAKKLDKSQLSKAGQTVANAYEGVRCEVEKEDTEFITLFFTVPQTEADPDATAEVEITVYDMGRDGLVMSLEADAADNDQMWDDAHQLAEDLAEQLGGKPIDV